MFLNTSSEAFLTQVYKKHSIRSYQDSKDANQWHAIFSRIERKDVDAVTDKERNEAFLGKLCFLRKYRHDLGEMSEIFMLPEKDSEMVEVVEEEPPEANEEVTTELNNLREDLEYYEEKKDKNDKGEEKREMQEQSADSKRNFDEKSGPSLLMVMTMVSGDVMG
ncbi:hypothetical protein L596_010258 [Steinernema carpocapsae]|uniref:Uncharacterized protein n=1 Tax=Steinernema carpocapsae TaxID=34508 RepID=A0A4U5PJ41_STECR|nr:hypothetical protein L596_010258 [Steinernema carpocapsae]